MEEQRAARQITLLAAPAVQCACCGPMATVGNGIAIDLNRPTYLRRGVWLEYLTVGWNSVEAVIAIASGLAATSIALIAFGLDSINEVAAGFILLWRLWAEQRGQVVREVVERRAIRLIGVSMFVLAVYVTAEALYILVTRQEAQESITGIVLVFVSLVVMPVIVWLKRRVARRLDSAALYSESNEQLMCTYLSFTVLVGLGANAIFGWWWADPVAGLAVVYFAVREGWAALTRQDLCCH